MQLLVLSGLLALAAAAPQQYGSGGFGNIISGQQVRQPEIQILSQYFNEDGQGNYEYGYEQDNGQKVDEVGRSYPGYEPGTGTITKEGAFEWYAPDGQKFRVAYVADEGGFQPQGDHLPVAPAQIPEYAQLQAQYPELFVPRQQYQ